MKIFRDRSSQAQDNTSYSEEYFDDIEVTIDGPKAYTKPFSATVHNRLLVDSQLIEFVCIDKDAQRYVGSEKKNP